MALAIINPDFGGTNQALGTVFLGISDGMGLETAERKEEEAWNLARIPKIWFGSGTRGGHMDTTSRLPAHNFVIRNLPVPKCRWIAR